MNFRVVTVTRHHPSFLVDYFPITTHSKVFSPLLQPQQLTIDWNVQLINEQHFFSSVYSYISRREASAKQISSCSHL